MKINKKWQNARKLWLEMVGLTEKDIIKQKSKPNYVLIDNKVCFVPRELISHQEFSKWYENQPPSYEDWL